MKVAVVDDMPAIGLSAESAKRFADMLNSQELLDRSPGPASVSNLTACTWGKRSRCP